MTELWGLNRAERLPCSHFDSGRDLRDWITKILYVNYQTCETHVSFIRHLNVHTYLGCDWHSVKITISDEYSIVESVVL